MTGCYKDINSDS